MQPRGRHMNYFLPLKRGERKRAVRQVPQKVRNEDMKLAGAGSA